MAPSLRSLKSYTYCGRSIKSDLLFPELHAHIGSDEEIFSLVRSERYREYSEECWFHSWQDEEELTWIRFGRDDAKFFFQVREIAHFEFDVNEKVLSFSPCEDVPEVTIRHVLLHQIFPVILSLNPEILILHASAVSMEDGVVAFLGRAGEGKSTVAAKLCRAGYPLVTDDVLLIEAHEGELRAVPSYPGIRLSTSTLTEEFACSLETEISAHYADKERVLIEENQLRFETRPKKLRQLFVLESPRSASSFEITDLQWPSVVPRLGPYVFQLDPFADEQQRAEFEFLNCLASDTPVARLCLMEGSYSESELEKVLLSHLSVGKN